MANEPLGPREPVDVLAGDGIVLKRGGTNQSATQLETVAPANPTLASALQPGLSTYFYGTLEQLKASLEAGEFGERPLITALRPPTDYRYALLSKSAPLTEGGMIVLTVDTFDEDTVRVTPTAGPVIAFGEGISFLGIKNTAGTITREFRMPALDTDIATGTDDERPVSAKAVKDWVDAQGFGAGTVVAWKEPVRFKTTGNVNLAGGGLADGTTHDGKTAVTGDRVLVATQDTSSQNGIYIVPASGAASRASDADAGTELPGAAVIVLEGDTLADTFWLCTTNSPITIGATSIAWAQFTMTVADGSITLAKMANLNQYEIIGRTSSSAGVPQAKATSANVWSLLGAANYAAILGLLDLEIGTDVRAQATSLAEAIALGAHLADWQTVTGNGTQSVTVGASGQGYNILIDPDGNFVLDAITNVGTGPTAGLVAFYQDSSDRTFGVTGANFISPAGLAVKAGANALTFFAYQYIPIASKTLLMRVGTD